MSDQVRHPEVRVRLAGEDGNAFFILGVVRAALRAAGVEEEEVRSRPAAASRQDIAAARSATAFAARFSCPCVTLATRRL